MRPPEAEPSRRSARCLGSKVDYTESRHVSDSDPDASDEVGQPETEGLTKVRVRVCGRVASVGLESTCIGVCT